MKILQLNIFCRPKIANTHGRDYRYLRLKQLLMYTAEYDIICLQELFICKSNKRPIDYFLQQLTQQGFKYMTSGPNPDANCCRGVTGGLFIASKHEFIDSHAEEFTDHGYQSDYFTRKGFLSVTMQYQNQRINVVTTHTQADYTNPGKTKPQKHINCIQNQIKQLNQFIRTLQGIKLVVGDFNTDAINEQATSYVNAQLDSNRFVQHGDIHYVQEGSKEYELLCKSMQNEIMQELVDVTFEQHKAHPITFGDFYVKNDIMKPSEVHMTSDFSQCTCQRLDYVFWFKDDIVKNISSTVKNFRFDGGGVIKQLSDHYGHEIVLEFQ